MDIKLNHSIEEARDMIVEIFNEFGIKPRDIVFSPQNAYIDIRYMKDTIGDIDVASIKQFAKKANPKCRFVNIDYKAYIVVEIPASSENLFEF